MQSKQQPKRKEDNRDPITGEPGAHPVGAGIGAAVGGGVGGAAVGAAAAVASGMAAGGTMGTVAGPIGAAVGAIAGGIAGGLAGKGIAESVDPTAEDAYWRNNFKKRPYYQNGAQYDDYQPAYRHGWESRVKYHDRPYTEVEADLERDWQEKDHPLEWDEAQPAVRDAWDRIDASQRQRAQKG